MQIKGKHWDDAAKLTAELKIMVPPAFSSSGTFPALWRKQTAIFLSLVASFSD